MTNDRTLTQQDALCTEPMGERICGYLQSAHGESNYHCLPCHETMRGMKDKRKLQL